MVCILKELTEYGFHFNNIMTREEFFNELAKVIRIEKCTNPDAFQEAFYFLVKNLKYEPNKSLQDNLNKAKKYFSLAYKSKSINDSLLDGTINGKVLTYPHSEYFSQNALLEYLDNREFWDKDFEEVENEKKQSLLDEDRLDFLKDYTSLLGVGRIPKKLINTIRAAYERRIRETIQPL